MRGLHLPALKKLRNQKIRAGKRLRLPVRSHTRELALSAESAGGASLAELGARFFDHGQGRGWLVWRPRPDQLGSHAFTFQGTTRSGLVTRQTIRIHVTRPKPRWKELRRFWRRVADGLTRSKRLDVQFEDG